MKAGDLVKFHSSAFHAAAQRYPKCGVVLDVRETAVDEYGRKTQGSAKILWADGQYTREWLCYVEVLNESR
jgi:hypothetical protein